MNKDTLVIYHKNCADGFTAAWAAHKKFGDRADYMPMAYGEELVLRNVADREIYILDFSFNENVMMDIEDLAKRVVILDHHITAQAVIEPLIDNKTNGIEGVFDMDRSGAMITWNYFFPDSEPPRLVRYVQDRDLWSFKLPYSKSISQYIFSYEYTFENWDKISKELENNLKQCAEEGMAIERKHLKDVAELVKATAIQNVKFDKWGCLSFTVANLPYNYASDACKYIIAHYQDEYSPQVGITYFQDSNGYYVFSLRGDGVEDVSELAKAYGGGGHRNAAGFVVKTIPFNNRGKNDSTP